MSVESTYTRRSISHILEYRSVSHPVRTYAPPSEEWGEERRGIARVSHGESANERKGADDACRRPRPERSHHRATTEKERGRILGKVNTFVQDRTFGVPTFSPHSFDFRLLLRRTMLSQPEIQIDRECSCCKVNEDNLDQSFIHNDVLRRFFTLILCNLIVMNKKCIFYIIFILLHWVLVIIKIISI